MSKEAARTERRDREQRICFGETFQLSAERQQILGRSSLFNELEIMHAFIPPTPRSGGVFDSMYVRLLKLFWN